MTFDLRRTLAHQLATATGDALGWEGKSLDWAWVRTVATHYSCAASVADKGGAGAALVARNRPEHVAILLARLAAGSSTSMVHCAQPPAALASDLAALALPLAIMDREDWSPVVAAALQATATSVMLIGGGLPPRLEEHNGTAPYTSPDTEIALRILSSGTTGTPKRVGLSWGTLSRAVADSQSSYVGTGKRSAPQVLVQPISTIAGISYMLPALAFGQQLVILDRFDIDRWLDAVVRFRPSRVSIPAAALRMLLDKCVPKTALAGVEVLAVGGSGLDPKLQARFESHFGVPVLTAYGATEFAGVVANWSLEMKCAFGASKAGSAGRASKGVELRVVDPEQGGPLPWGQIGLLEIRAERLGPDWIHSTDLARIDDDGFLFLCGRADGAINRGGFKVLPETVAAALMSHPAVAEAAVIGIEDERLGEVPAAAVELREGHSVSGEELRTFLKERLTAYHIPIEVRVLEHLPRTAMLKVALGELRSILRQPGSFKGSGDSTAP